jgi:hypothetical protein
MDPKCNRGSLDSAEVRFAQDDKGFGGERSNASKATALAVLSSEGSGGSTMAMSTAKKSSAHRKSTRKYSPAAGKDVETEMKAMKEGKLMSGRSGKKVTNPKQAIAIGLSKARKEGKKVPAPKS